MLKKHLLIKLILSLSIVTFSSPAFAQTYTGRQGNEATFETLQEARVNGPNAVAQIYGNRGTYKSHPVLDNYPEGTTFIYRSPNLYGGHAAARLNTDILVFVEKAFADKNEAKQYPLHRTILLSIKPANRPSNCSPLPRLTALLPLCIL